MSNRDALRRLSRQFPGDQEVDNIIMALHKEGDRTVAIIGSSLVESVLEQLLTSSFKSKSADLLPRLFENRGPLSDFNSKILIAEAFGVVNAKQAEELQRVRHIRNCFAHARLPVTFDTPQIATEVQDFVAVIAIKNVKEKNPGRSGYDYMTNKDAFVLICHLLMIMLEDEHVKRGGKPLLPKAEPSPEK